MGYEYDRLGRITKCVYPDGTSTSYVYDGIHLGKVLRSGQQNYDHEYTYDLSGRVNSERLLGAAGHVDYKYDIQGRYLSIIHHDWSESVDDYDDVGNLLNTTIQDRVDTSQNSYKYDSLNQLIYEKGVQEHTYVYDSLYNRVRIDTQANVINDLNQLIHTPFFDYKYDLNGNLIRKSNYLFAIEYEYDALDRLTTVRQGNSLVRYVYDESDRRIRKDFFMNDGNFAKSICYLYQGMCEIGAVDEGGGLSQLRVLGAGLGGEIGAAVAFELEGNIYVPIYDHSGNVATLLDRDGNAVETYRYDAFGVETRYDSIGGSINPWRYMSKRVDEETGLVHFGRRYYDPLLGRWTTMDPLGYSAGSPNLYAYLMNSPLTHIDPYGLSCEEALSSLSRGLTHIAQSAYNFASGLIHGFGMAIKNFAYHMLPPFIKDPFTYLGYIISGGNLGYTCSRHEDHSGANLLHAKNSYTIPHVLIMVCGILTDFDTMLNHAKMVSEAHDGVEVFFVSNATHGLVTDVGETLFQKFGILTHSVASLHEAFNMVDEQYGVDVPKTLYAFSQGGEIVYDAMKSLSKAHLDSTRVFTFGSARMIPNGYFASAVNYINLSDPIPFVANFFGILYGLYTHECNIGFLPPTDPPFLGHTFDSKSYQSMILGHGFYCRAAYGTKL